MGNRESGIGNRESGIGNRESSDDSGSLIERQRPRTAAVVISLVAPEKPPDRIHCKASPAVLACWNCQCSLRYVLVSGSFRPCVHAVLPPSSCLPMSCFVRAWRTRSTCAIHWSS
ncbi:hypothetical protein BRN54_25140 [Xanthomonas oryzae pv. oryzae]|nr:hypothetical protein BRN54_25140 [Xanthomonas oryzae pv. oryzae]